MSEKNTFPKGFLWGAATSSHQVEGGQHNDWSEWEKKNADRLAAESRHYDNPYWERFAEQAADPKNYLSGDACDQYHRYEEDFNILRDLHLDAYRFSIEWARIEPEEGTFDQEAIEHYRNVIAALRTRNIEPFVTLWHWTLPLWLSEKGGTASKEFPMYFERYAKTIADTLGTEIRYWITLNEPDVQTSFAYLLGQWTPERKNIFLAIRAYRNLVQAHNRAAIAIQKIIPDAQVGISKHQVYFEMARPTLINKVIKFAADWPWNFYFLNQIDAHQDFIGMNSYQRKIVNNGLDVAGSGIDPEKDKDRIQTEFGWEYSPTSIYGALMELKRYGKPIYITENGIADSTDELRPRFIRDSLAAIHHAIEDGMDIRGYFYWSLLDNFEWDKGFWPRFGLVHVDYATQKRTIRDSARLYGRIADANSLETP
jgi:beta-glucosidase